MITGHYNLVKLQYPQPINNPFNSNIIVLLSFSWLVRLITNTILVIQIWWDCWSWIYSFPVWNLSVFGHCKGYTWQILNVGFLFTNLLVGCNRKNLEVLWLNFSEQLLKTHMDDSLRIIPEHHFSQGAFWRVFVQPSFFFWHVLICLIWIVIGRNKVKC